MLVVCIVFVAVILVLVLVELWVSVGFTIVVLRDMLVPVPMLAVFVVLVAFALSEASAIGQPVFGSLSYLVALAYALTDAGMAP
jgi:hypothetical protein